MKFRHSLKANEIELSAAVPDKICHMFIAYYPSQNAMKLQIACFGLISNEIIINFFM